MKLFTSDQRFDFFLFLGNILWLDQLFIKVRSNSEFHFHEKVIQSKDFLYEDEKSHPWSKLSKEFHAE
jgi:hypothetical protein